MSEALPWWEAAFGSGYAAVYPHRDLAAARREVAGLLDLGLKGRILDLACGFGRHLLALRERGLDAWGLDRSAELLSRADPSLFGRIVRGDVRALPLRDRSFDSVAMLFSSFGYFDEDGNREVLRGIGRVLRPGGLLVLDLMNAGRVRAGLVPASERESGGWRVHEVRTLAEGGRRVRKQVRLRSPEGHEHSWNEDVRLYETAETEELAASCGLLPQRWVGDFDGSPPGPEAARAIALLRKQT